MLTVESESKVSRSSAALSCFGMGSMASLWDYAKL